MPNQRGEKSLKIREAIHQLGSDCSFEQVQAKVAGASRSSFYKELREYREELQGHAAKNGKPASEGEKAILEILERLRYATQPKILEEMTKKKVAGTWTTQSSDLNNLIYQMLSNIQTRKGLIARDRPDSGASIWRLATTPPYSKDAEVEAEVDAALAVEKPSQQDLGGIIELVQAGKRLVERLGGKEKAKQLLDVL
jgi:hypothetical protein